LTVSLKGYDSLARSERPPLVTSLPFVSIGRVDSLIA
jgi:hypothetical protein